MDSGVSGSVGERRREYTSDAQTLRTLQYVAAGITAAVAIVSLIGWLTGLVVLASVENSYIPMAPATAIVFLALSSIVVFRLRVDLSRRHRTVMAVAGLICAAMALELVDITTGLAVGPDRLFLPRIGVVGEVGALQIGRMSPVTALAFIGLAVAIGLFESRQVWREGLATAIALLVALGAFVLLVGYTYEAPLLYGGGFLPVALPTAAGLLLLGIGIASFGTDRWPFELFAGDSVRARLTRTVVPVAVVPIVAVALLDALSIRMGLHQTPLLLSLLFVLMLALVTSIVLRAATTIGDQLDAAEAALRKSEENFSLALKASDMGTWLWDPSAGEFDWPAESKALFGLPAEAEVDEDQFRSLIHPDDRKRADDALHAALDTFGDYDQEYRVVWPDGSVHWIHSLGRASLDDSGNPIIRGVRLDITERKNAEQELRERTEDLERSNRDLENFAYVASHDLQEPLRMVASYTQLLAKRYRGKLDSDADDFINFAVDGATRMQTLINDLLSYSRVGTQGAPFVTTDLQVVLDQVLHIMEHSIAENDAIVTHDDMPTVACDAIQIGRVFQNLIGNAIKFRGESPLAIHIGVQGTDTEWVFSVQDNGIGIDPQYFDRIFTIFQRLESRSEYDGTGMGLAICKRVVERHHGRIWVESRPSEGSTFYFSLGKQLEEVPVPRQEGETA